MFSFRTLITASSVFVTLMTGCGNREQATAYTVSVEFPNIPDSTEVVLRPIGHNRDAANLAESYIIGGKAILEGTVDEPTGAYLRLSNGSGVVPLMIENCVISVNGEVPFTPSQRDESYYIYDYSGVKVEGSDLQSRLDRLTALKDSFDVRHNEGRVRYGHIAQRAGVAHVTKNKALMDSVCNSDEYKAYEQFEHDFMQDVDASYRQAIREGNDSYWGPLSMLYFYVYFVSDMRPIYEEFSDEAKSSTYGRMVEQELYPVGRPGDKLCNFETVTSNGDSIIFDEIVRTNKLTLIDFWASWCGPCRREIPNLKKLYAKYKDKGFDIVSVSIDKEDEAWRKALEAECMVWTNCRDMDGSISKDYHVQSIPMLVVVDGEGRLVIENMRGDDLDMNIRKLIDNI